MVLDSIRFGYIRITRFGSVRCFIVYSWMRFGSVVLPLQTSVRFGRGTPSRSWPPYSIRSLLPSSIRSGPHAQLRSAPLGFTPGPHPTPTLCEWPSFLPSFLCARLRSGSDFLAQPSYPIRAPNPIRSETLHNFLQLFPATCLRHSTTFSTNLTFLNNQIS